MRKNFMHSSILSIFVVLSLLTPIFVNVGSASAGSEGQKVRIKAIGIPLADHYAAIVAYEKYSKNMKYADFQLKLLPGPTLVRAYFGYEPDADIALNVCPMVMDMYRENPDFRWVSLVHRDGNALAVNDVINSKVLLPDQRAERKPDQKLADAFSSFREEMGKPVVCAIPSPLATHATVLYKYLKDYNKTMSSGFRDDVDIVYKIVKPPRSPAFLKKSSARSLPAAFEQSLPWAEVAENVGSGRVAWYSKDVLNHKLGHVECVIIAKNSVIKEKKAALREVVTAIHQAGYDIEVARRSGDLKNIIAMIQKHIPSHSKEAISQSLRPDLNVINYLNLNIDANSKASLRKIMNLAFEAGFLKTKIDIDAMADESFATSITTTEFVDNVK